MIFHGLIDLKAFINVGFESIEKAPVPSGGDVLRGIVENEAA